MTERVEIEMILTTAGYIVNNTTLVPYEVKVSETQTQILSNE